MAYKQRPRISRIYAEMKRRCYNPNDAAYSRYGGSGITVSEDWLNYQNFKRDMLPTYQDNLTLDRIDNSKGYCKENCRWSTMQEQQRNRTNNVRLTYNGLTLLLGEWAEQLHIKRSTLAQRHYVYGWDAKKTLTTPVRNRG